jgi:DNA-binding MarR family transcriptional regulator
VKHLELAIRSGIDDLVGEFGVTALQYTALSVLARHPGMSSAELSRRSFVSPQAGNEMIGLLERKDLLERAPDPANRRILRISLTGPGRELLSKCDERVDGLEERMLGPLTTARRRELRAALDVCVHAINSPSPGRASAQNG